MSVLILDLKNIEASPSKAFRDKPKSERLRFPSDAGILPESRFRERINPVKSFGNDPYDSGIVPVSWLPSNAIPPRLGIVESEAGRGPVSLLLLRVMVTRVLISESISGISPEMLVWVIERNRRLERFEMDCGIGPTRLGMRVRKSKLREGRLVMEGGIDTGFGRSRSERSRSVTR